MIDYSHRLVFRHRNVTIDLMSTREGWVFGVQGDTELYGPHDTGGVAIEEAIKQAEKQSHAKKRRRHNRRHH